MTDQIVADRQEWARLLLNEWKFRQAHCWRLLQIYGLAAVAVSVAPYLVPDLRQGAGDWVLGFPFFGIMIGAVVLWLFSAEYQQCKLVLHKYRKLQRDAGSEFYPWTEPPRRSTPIGVAIPRMFMLAFVIASAGNVFFLYVLNHSDVNWALDISKILSVALAWVRGMLGGL